MKDRIIAWWRLKTLKRDRLTVDEIFAGYSGDRREQELKRLIFMYFPLRHLHKNNPKKEEPLMGWSRARYPSGEE